MDQSKPAKTQHSTQDLSSPSVSPPRGREAVRAALINAAAYCFANRGIKATSVREIAARAHVNHGLIHRHFGSKDQLLRELLCDLSTRVDQHLNDLCVDEVTPPPSELLPTILMGTREVGLHWRVVLRALLEGIPPQELQTHFPVFSRLVDSYRTLGVPESDALAEAVLAFSTGLGFLTFQHYLEAAVNYEGSDWKQLRPMLMRRFLGHLSVEPVSSPESG